MTKKKAGTKKGGGPVVKLPKEKTKKAAPRKKDSLAGSGGVKKVTAVVGRDLARQKKAAKQFHIAKREHLGALLIRLILRSSKMETLLRGKQTMEMEQEE